MLALFTRFHEAVVRDVADLNETKRTAVLTRLLSLVMMVYLLCQVALLYFYGSPVLAVLPFIVFIAFAVTVYLSYKKNTEFVRRMCMACLYVWIIVLVPLVGWSSTGAQNFLFVMLLFAFMTSYDNLNKKIRIPVILFLTRIVLFVWAYYRGPYVEIKSGGETYFQITNSAALFVIMTFLVIYFSQHALEMEKKLIAHNRQIEAEAEHDALTGLFNRRAINEHISKEIAGMNKNHKGMCIAIGDLDEFKLINDMYGHDAGDMVLKKISEIFETFMKGNGYVARWGGEEFIFVFTRNHKEVCAEKLEMLRKTIMLSEMEYGEHEIKVTMTFGLEEYQMGENIDEVLIKADRKLYQGKTSGRNQVVS